MEEELPRNDILDLIIAIKELERLICGCFLATVAILGFLIYWMVKGISLAH